MVTAAIAALGVAAGQRVAVLKPAQTGVGAHEPGDLDEIARLAGDLTTRELRRYPDPLAPNTAAARANLPSLHPGEITAEVSALAAEHDLVLIEGAGGLLVRFDDQAGTLADVAWALNALVLVVAEAGLGTLNLTALTAEVLLRRGIECGGVIIGSWPAEPDLAAQCNLADLPEVAGAPLLGALPENAALLTAAEFLEVARQSMSPWLGGVFDPETFADQVLRRHG